MACIFGHHQFRARNEFDQSFRRCQRRNDILPAVQDQRGQGNGCQPGFEVNPFYAFHHLDRLTEWGSGALDRLVNKRHEQMLPTWLTTNLDPSDGGPLKEYLGNRSWSRLMEDAHIVVMNGADRRLR